MRTDLRIPKFGEVAAQLGRGRTWLAAIRVAMGKRPRELVTAKQVRDWYDKHPYFNSGQVKGGVWTPPTSEGPQPASVDTAERSLLNCDSRTSLLRLQAGQLECNGR